MKVVLKTPSLSEQTLLKNIFNRIKEMPSGNLLVIWGPFLEGKNDNTSPRPLCCSDTLLHYVQQHRTETDPKYISKQTQGDAFWTFMQKVSVIIFFSSCGPNPPRSFNTRQKYKCRNGKLKIFCCDKISYYTILYYTMQD